MRAIQKLLSEVLSLGLVVVTVCVVKLTVDTSYQAGYDWELRRLEPERYKQEAEQRFKERISK